MDTAELERELKRYLYAGVFPDVLRRVAYQPWLARAEVRCFRPTVSKISPDLAALTMFISCQQNSCRYCYGAARSILRILGLHEGEIRSIERKAGTAEENNQPVTRFVRKLAEADPRPGKTELDELRQSGLDQTAIAEIIGVVTAANFSNRNCTFLAAPPENHLEHMAETFVGKVMRLLWGKKNGAVKPRSDDLDVQDPGDAFSPFVGLVAGTAYAKWLRNAVDGCLASPSIAAETKLMMFAVIGRTLQCPAFETACEHALIDSGWTNAEIGACLSSLKSPRLPEGHEHLLTWTRETVWYDTFDVQEKTRELAERMDDTYRLVDAVGTAALGNALVRLGLLL